MSVQNRDFDDLEDRSPFRAKEVAALARQSRRMATDMRRFIIAGMHRSGTSTVARVSNILGLDLGPDNELMGPAPDNPQGFWENESLTKFNDGVLYEAGGTWDEPPTFDLLANSPRAEGLRKHAKRLLDKTLRVDPGGWKDPRGSLLAWLWEPLTAGVVVCIRNPDAVAGSLAKRNHMPPDQCHRLWVRYTLESLRFSVPRLIVPIERLNTELEVTCKRLSSFLEVPDPGTEQITLISEYLGSASPGESGSAGNNKWRSVAFSIYENLLAGDEVSDLEAHLALVKEPAWRSQILKMRDSVDALEDQLREATETELSLLRRNEDQEAEIARLSASLGQIEVDATLAIERVKALRLHLGDDQFWRILTDPE